MRECANEKNHLAKKQEAITKLKNHIACGFLTKWKTAILFQWASRQNILLLDTNNQHIWKCKLWSRKNRLTWYWYKDFVGKKGGNNIASYIVKHLEATCDLDKNNPNKELKKQDGASTCPISCWCGVLWNSKSYIPSGWPHKKSVRLVVQSSQSHNLQFHFIFDREIDCSVLCKCFGKCKDGIWDNLFYNER